jgi:hypothetical protein
MQEFRQRLEMRLNPRIGTKDDFDQEGQARFFAELMMKMQRGIR